VRLPVALSLTGHAFFLALLAVFAGRVVPLATPPAPKGIELSFAPPLPAAAPAPLVPPPEARPIEPAQQPRPEPTATLPPAAAVVAAPEVPTVKPERSVVAVEPPPPKPLQKPAPPRREPRVTRRRPPPAPSTPPRVRPPAAPVAAEPVPRAAAPPAPPPAAAVSGSYRTRLAEWFERHKRYPEAARARGEEGRVVLRFAVDRNGRVLEHEVVRSSGHPDLDRAVGQMMRAATLPAFPASMPQQQIEVSITIRFALAQ